eukprot:3004135-Amphidinium_carterae.1
MHSLLTDVLNDIPGNVGVMELVVLDVAVEYDVLKFGRILVDVDVVMLDVLGDGVLELIDADVVEDDDDVLKRVLCNIGVVELVVLDAEVKHDVLKFEGVLVDVDVVLLDVLGDGVLELIDADIVEDVDVLEEVLGNVGVVELVALDAGVKHDVLKFEGVLVDVDVVEPDVLGDEVHELVDADVVEDVDVLKRLLGN